MNEHISFSQKLVDWYNLHGRHNLPWQAKQTAYHVWISEIMLQQTQVATVIPYFKNFIQKLPTINALAAAQEDDVMRLWTGLGYYSRARNLMKTARIIQTIYHGEFPRKIDRLIALPGIGRSTAGAIISLAFEAKAPILDGNVKRVLARYHGILGWPGNGKVARKFWAVAEASLPDKDHRAYAQSLMDLGATLCTRSKPDCTRCPLKEKCHAKKNNKISELPGKKPPQIIKRQSFFFIIIMNQLGNILLQKQPPKGVWGGLWCFPKAEDEKECSIVLDRLNIGKWQQLETMSSFQHRLTHVAFQITPLLFSSSVSSKDAATVDNVAWYNIRETELVGLPAPVKKLMLKLARAQEKLLQ
jgi:A/G-specific adenine glycosylase